MRIAKSRLRCWLRSACDWTTIPVGRWVRRTADSVLLTCCPPAPEARNVSTRRSAGEKVEGVGGAPIGKKKNEGEEGWRPRGAAKRGERDRTTSPASALREATAVF